MKNAIYLALIDSLKRLIFSSRLYHPRWLALVSEAISSILFPTAVIVLFFLSLGDAQWEAAALLLSSYSIYTLGLLLIMLIVEYGIQQVIRSQGQPVTKLSPDYGSENVASYSLNTVGIWVSNAIIFLDVNS